MTFPIPQNKYEIVMASFQKYLDLVNDYAIANGRSEVEMPVIDFSLKGTTAGTADSRTNVVNLNKVLLLENFNLYQVRTIPHELAHIAVTIIFGHQKRSHGKYWKFIMERIFNVDSSRCHSMDTANSMVRNTKKFLYSCGCSESFLLGAIRHNRAVSGDRNYTCTKCNTSIKYLGTSTDKSTLMAERAKK